MNAWLELSLAHGLDLCVLFVVLGGLLARGLLVPVRAVLSRLSSVARIRHVRRSFGASDRIAFTPQDDGREVTLEGLWRASDVALAVGAGSVSLPAAWRPEKALRDGDRVIARGRLRRSADEGGAMFREPARSIWALDATDASHAMEALAVRGARLRASGGDAMSAVVGASLALAAVGLGGDLALVTLGAPQRSIVAASATELVWESRWSSADALPASVALCSPWHRRRALAMLQEVAGRESFSLQDGGQVHTAAYALRARGRCVEAAALLYDAGFLNDARDVGLRCDSPLSDELVWSVDHALGISPYADERVLRTVSERIARQGTLDLRTEDIFALPRMIEREPAGAHRDLFTRPELSGANVALRCVERALVHHAYFSGNEGSTVHAEVPAAYWDDMLRSPSVACRVIAATRIGRRDDASLRALDEAAATATPRWRPLLDAARDLLVLEGARTHALRNPPPCARQAPHGHTTAARYARMPEVTGALIVATDASSCPWMVENIRLPAQEGLLRYVLDTGGTGMTLYATLWSEGARPYSTKTMRAGPEWLVYAWQGYEMALASRADAHRRDPRFDDAWEASLRAGLARVLLAGSQLAVRQIDRPSDADSLGARQFALSAPAVAWRRFLTLAGVDPRPGLTPPDADFLTDDAPDAQTHVSALFRAVGGRPERVAELTERAMAATPSDDARAVIEALRAPTHAAIEALATVAPRLTRHNDEAVAWMRTSLSTPSPAAMIRVDRMRHLDAIGRALHALGVPATEMHREIYVRPVEFAPGDPFLTEVVEVMRAETLPPLYGSTGP